MVEGSVSVLLTIRIFAWHEEIRLRSKRRLRDRQKQNTNRILNHGGHSAGFARNPK